ncbi:MAG: response regulator [Bacteroidetes bacterium]|nr:response regulator [Bacteroidota bacterium]
METQTLTVKTSVPSKKKEVKIFVVDDDPMYRQALEHRFRNYPGYRVYSFKTGEECFKHIHVIDPDIIILDYSLNKSTPNAMNGVEILKRLKNIKPQIPVLMLSGQENITIATNCIKYGAFDYIIKSESAFVRLQHLITRILDKIKLQQEMKEQELFGKVITISVILAMLVPIGTSYFIPNYTHLVILAALISIFTLVAIINAKFTKGHRLL